MFSVQVIKYKNILNWICYVGKNDIGSYFFLYHNLYLGDEYEKNKNNEVLQWMKFLDNPEDMEVRKIMEENQDIKEAKEELDKISQDDILRRMALKAKLERMDNKQQLYEAKRDGKAEGRAEGRLDGIKETAIKMLKKQINIQVIKEVTGLTEEEIKKLQK